MLIFDILMPYIEIWIIFILFGIFFIENYEAVRLICNSKSFFYHRETFTVLSKQTYDETRFCRKRPIEGLEEHCYVHGIRHCNITSDNRQGLWKGQKAGHS